MCACVCAWGVDWYVLDVRVEDEFTSGLNALVQFKATHCMGGVGVVTIIDFCVFTSYKL